MGYFLAGIVILISTTGAWWVCLPGADGQAKAFLLKNGADAWAAIAITFGAALGIAAVIFGGIAHFGPLG